MGRSPATLNQLLYRLVAHRQLLLGMASREFVARFRGSILGVSWVVLTPLLMAAIYTFVFSAVFKMRWPGDPNNSASDFAINLLIGLAVHGVFVECISRGPSLVVANSSYVTKVVFPLEVLPFVVLLSALTTAAISLAVASVINLALTEQLRPTAFFLPLLVIPFATFIAAFTMVLAAVGVYLRDLSQVTNLIIPVSLFLTPIFYPIDAVPNAMKPFMLANPLTFMVEQTRAILLRGEMPNFLGLALYTATSVAALSIAYWIFQHLRKGFADVL